MLTYLGKLFIKTACLPKQSLTLDLPPLSLQFYKPVSNVHPAGVVEPFAQI